MTGPPSPTKVPRIRILQHSKQRHWPGTSKWNKIEHRLFSAISSNWRGQPLTSHEVVVATIGATRTRAGLSVHAELDPGEYPTGITVPDDVMDRLPLSAHDWHGTWNYTLRPEPLAPAAPGPDPDFGRFPAGDKAPGWLRHPSLTGMEAHEFNALLARYTRYLAEHPPILMPGIHHSGAGTRLLSAADRLLVCILTKRWSIPQKPLAALLGVCAARIGVAVRETTSALADLDVTIAAGAIKATAVDQLAAIAGHETQPPKG